MQQLLDRLDQSEAWKEGLKKTARKNRVHVTLASYFSPSKIKNFHLFLLKRFNQQISQKKKFWIENQLRALHWILLAISFVQNKPINNFEQKEFQILSQIFPGKNHQTFQYEIIRLIDQKKSQNKNWKDQQNQFLIDIIESKSKNQDKANKWNDIARELYQKSKGQYFRTGKQCRQRWLNHLDPSKKHGQWTQKDDFIIAKTILSIGKKWSEIGKLLKDRTEHMVKNRYKSLIIKYQKVYGKSENQNSIFIKIIKNYQGQQPIIQQRQVLTPIKTRNQSLQQSSPNQCCRGVNQKNPRSILMKSFEVIHEQDNSSQNAIEEQNKKPQTCQQIINFQEIFKKPINQKQSYENNYMFGMQLQLIQSPQNLWSCVRTPGYYGFSPSNANGFPMSFSQYQHNFLSENNRSFDN